MSFFDKLMSRLRKQPKPAPKQKLGLGHRGVGIGSTKTPDLSQANVEKWQILPANEAEAFVYEGKPFYPHSTNVFAMVYKINPDRRTGDLMVEFVSGHAGTYRAVPVNEAVNFTTAHSKGSFIYDVLIGRENLPGNSHWTKNGGHSRYHYDPIK